MTSREDYVANFAGGTRQEEALKVTLDIRKFEIEMYWKRATYFWTILAITFVGYFAIGQEDRMKERFTVCCLGLVFAVAWYCVNRGSSAWQRNWEKQVDLLEDEIIGPLYKSVINKRTYSFRNLAGPYGFSPSRVNTLLSLFVCLVWAILSVSTLLAVPAHQAWALGTFSYLLSVSLVTVAMLAIILLRGSTIASDEVIEIDIHRRLYQ